jgi:hypothetical protein
MVLDFELEVGRYDGQASATLVQGAEKVSANE